MGCITHALTESGLITDYMKIEHEMEMEIARESHFSRSNKPKKRWNSRLFRIPSMESENNKKEKEGPKTRIPFPSTILPTPMPIGHVDEKEKEKEKEKEEATKEPQRASLSPKASSFSPSIPLQHLSDSQLFL